MAELELRDVTVDVPVLDGASRSCLAAPVAASAAPAFTELGDYLAMPVHTYSAGMRFRLGFAAWTSCEPDILLVDEWMAAGDRGFLAKAHRRLEEFSDGAGIVVLASQDAALQRRLCTSAVLLETGRVRALGQVDAVLDAYRAGTVPAARHAEGQG